MQILISVDMEGVAGVVAPDDITPGHAEYERNRRYMTDEAGAAVLGCLAAEPDADIIVLDAHAAFRNILPDRLVAGCALLRGSPRRHAMMTGIDQGVDAVCFIGYHGKAGTSTSVLAHTISGSTIAQVRCNGVELGELGLNVELAAHHGAASILATGDNTLVAEAASTVPGIECVEVKKAFGNRAARSLHPDEACRRIQAAAQKALQGPLQAASPRFKGPVDLEVDMLRPSMTELPLGIPGVELRAPLTLGFSAADYVAAYELIEVFTVLAAAS
jgi:D-amino peptidase